MRELQISIRQSQEGGFQTRPSLFQHFVAGGEGPLTGCASFATDFCCDLR
jgi:hypothetical protein